MSNAQTVVFGTVNICKYLVAAKQPKGDFKNIQMLDTSNSHLSLYAVLCLLKALPALTKLKNGTNGLGPEFAHLSLDELPNHIASSYHS
ncbi:hypothetical protein IWW37_005910, partial [Coemansia sp. RSA 2050]